MPIFVAYVKVEELDGVASVSPAPFEEATFTIDAKNGMSDEVRRGVTIAPADENDIAGSRGVANLVLRFDDSKEQASCSCLSAADYTTRFKKKKAALKETPRPVTGADAGEWVPFLAFEARGMDVVALTLGVDDVVVTSSGGAVITGVDLGDGDWADYDEAAGCSVSLTGVETKVERV